MAGAESQNRQHCQQGSDDGCLEIGIKAMVHPGFSPAFWDNLSKVWLTRGALKEIDRRNAAHPTPPRRASTLPSRKAYSESLERFARHGGPDLCHLRGYHNPDVPAGEITDWTKSDMVGPFDAEFQQHLADHGIRMPGRRWETGGLDKLRSGLTGRRASLSSSQFSSGAFESVLEDNEDGISELNIVTKVIPVLCGSAKIPNQQNMLFTEMEPVTKEGAVKPRPDFFDGARLLDLDKSIRDDPRVRRVVVPTKHFQVPVAPNFFLEIKGSKGLWAVAQTQACYYGAYGARAMHALQNHGRADVIYDGDAYAFSAIYVSAPGMLTIYAHHVTAPTTTAEEGGAASRPEYHMTKVHTFCLTNTREGFVEGATAFRNIRDMARKRRDDIIREANARASEAAKTAAQVATATTSATAEVAVADASHHDSVPEDHSQEPGQESVVPGDDGASMALAPSARPDVAAPGPLPSKKRSRKSVGQPWAPLDDNTSKRRTLRSTARQ